MKSASWIISNTAPAAIWTAGASMFILSYRSFRNGFGNSLTRSSAGHSSQSPPW